MKSKISIIGVIALVLLILLVMTVNAGCSSEPKIITTVSPTPNTTPSTPAKDIPTGETDVPDVLIAYEDSLNINAKLFDTKKVFEEYITFLTESLRASENDELDVENFQKRITWFSIISESNINNNEREYKYAEVVYYSWVSLRIDSEFYDENSMTEELENAIRNTLTMLSDFRENPAEYPYP
jgi:hypothetical protein